MRMTLLSAHATLHGGRVDDDWPAWRRFLSWWGSRVYAPTILGLHVHDCNSRLQVPAPAVLQTIGLPQVRSNGYVFQVEIAYLCQKHGFSVLEIPIYFEDRVPGQVQDVGQGERRGSLARLADEVALPQPQAAQRRGSLERAARNPRQMRRLHMAYRTLPQ